MKHRLCAILLASGLSASFFAAGVYAQETDMMTEQVTEAETAGETASGTDDGTEAAETEAADADAAAAQDDGSGTKMQEPKDAAGELESDIEEISEAGSEEAAAQSDPANVQEQINEYMKQSTVQLLEQLSEMSDEELQTIIDEGDASSALIAANWVSVKQDLGKFAGVEDQQVERDGNILRAVSKVKYDGIDDKTAVTVTYEVDQAAQTFSVEWDVKYPIGTLMQQAALNTVMGLGIVFLTLFFLSWVIGKLHIIPDMIENRAGRGDRRKPAPASQAPSVSAQPSATSASPAKPHAAASRGKHMDDLELVAVIAAAIAAAENTSADSFVVRSIKKVNKSKWQKRA